jgi:hypothetical protein
MFMSLFPVGVHELRREYLHVPRQHHDVYAILRQEIQDPRFLLGLRLPGDRQVVEGDAVVFHPRGEVRVVGDDQRYLGVELPCVPAPEEVCQAVVVAGDEDRHALRGVGVADAPVHAVAAREGAESAGKLVAGQAEALALDLQAHKERASVSHVLVGGEDVAIVHGDKRGEGGDQALPVAAGDGKAQVGGQAFRCGPGSG